MNWIEMTRGKSQREISVPLLKKAQELLDVYSKEDSVISNQQYNSYLKVIGTILNLEKNLTTHMARKTFASTVLLYNDVPIEIVSKLLGHSSISVTEECYGKVIKKKVSAEVMKLNSRFNRR